LATCDKCKRKSSVGPDFKRTRATMFFILFLAILGTAIGVSVGTHKWFGTYKVLIALYIALFLLSAYFFYRALYYMTIKTSSIEASPT